MEGRSKTSRSASWLSPADHADAQQFAVDDADRNLAGAAAEEAEQRAELLAVVKAEKEAVVAALLADASTKKAASSSAKGSAAYTAGSLPSPQAPSPLQLPPKPQTP